ncbi:unnamed protein product, partial [Colletotrichum noveboracense]
MTLSSPSGSISPEPWVAARTTLQTSVINGHPSTQSHAGPLSYAAAAAKGPKQTPEEAAAPQPPEVAVTDSAASTSSLVDVDMPSVHTVPNDFLEQEIQTETQADRRDREEKARAEADLAKKKAASKARRADSW